MKYKCIVSYDGVDYNGYQRQKHDKNTIQEVIENVLSYIFKEKITIVKIIVKVSFKDHFKFLYLLLFANGL